MTEEEAKTKWCPFARPSQNHPDECGEIRGNRALPYEPRTYPDSCLCLGSACMAWRWNKVLVRGCDEEGDMMATSHTHGHCGLARSE